MKLQLAAFLLFDILPKLIHSPEKSAEKTVFAFLKGKGKVPLRQRQRKLGQLFKGAEYFASNIQKHEYDKARYKQHNKVYREQQTFRRVIVSYIFKAVQNAVYFFYKVIAF